MKQRLALLLILLTLCVKGQTGSDKRTTDYAGLHRFNGSMKLPPRLNPFFPVPEEGQVAYDAAMKGLVYYNGTDWTGTGGAQFTDPQRQALLALIYQSNSSTLSVAPLTGERGITTPITVTYSITTGNDVFTSASINQGVGAATWNDGNHNVTGGSRAATTIYTLTKNFTRNGNPTTQTQTATYTAYAPQWSGVSTTADFADNYSTINGQSGFVKAVQAGTISISRSFTTTGTNYPYFITTVAAGVIKDANGFSYSITNVTDFSNLTGVTGYWVRHPLTLTLNDGTTTTLYIIRARELVTLSGFTFTHSN